MIVAREGHEFPRNGSPRGKACDVAAVEVVVVGDPNLAQTEGETPPRYSYHAAAAILRAEVGCAGDGEGNHRQVRGNFGVDPYRGAYPGNLTGGAGVGDQKVQGVAVGGALHEADDVVRGGLSPGEIDQNDAVGPFAACEEQEGALEIVEEGVAVDSVEDLVPPVGLNVVGSENVLVREAYEVDGGQGIFELEGAPRGLTPLGPG